MSDHGPGPAPFRRPAWIIPVAVLGALLILIGIVLTINWSGGNDDEPVPFTGTTTTFVSGG